jgi:hypothetical protein
MLFFDHPKKSDEKRRRSGTLRLGRFLSEVEMLKTDRKTDKRKASISRGETKKKHIGFYL